MTLKQQSNATARNGLRRWMSAGAAALALAAGLWSSPAHAQRGERYALDEELAVSPRPDDGFPGLFDTQLARKGSVVSNLPAASVYLGLTRKLTLGTVLWSYLPLANGLASGSVHARYRLGSSTWFRSTADTLFFGTRLRDGQQESTLWSVLLGSNNEFVLHDAHRLTVSGWLGHISGSPENGMAASATAALLGGTYSLIFARWGSLDLTGMYLVSGTGSMGVTGMSADINWSGGIDPGDRLLVRGLFNFRSGSWLFGVGALRTASILTPWLNVGFEIGG
jgi:hypothetical protein